MGGGRGRERPLPARGIYDDMEDYTTGGDMKDGVYQYCTSNKLHDHLASFVQLTSECARLPLKVIYLSCSSTRS